MHTPAHANESSIFRIIITALQVIEARFGIVVISAVEEGIEHDIIRTGAFVVEFYLEVAPGIIGVRNLLDTIDNLTGTDTLIVVGEG